MVIMLDDSVRQCNLPTLAQPPPCGDKGVCYGPVAFQNEDHLPQAGEYWLVSAKLHRQGSTGSSVGIYLESPDFPPQALAEKIQRAVQERRGKGVKARIRLSLISDVTLTE